MSAGIVTERQMASGVDATAQMRTPSPLVLPDDPLREFRVCMVCGLVQVAYVHNKDDAEYHPFHADTRE